MTAWQTVQMDGGLARDKAFNVGLYGAKLAKKDGVKTQTGAIGALKSTAVETKVKHRGFV